FGVFSGCSYGCILVTRCGLALAVVAAVTAVAVARTAAIAWSVFTVGCGCCCILCLGFVHRFLHSLCRSFQLLRGCSLRLHFHVAWLTLTALAWLALSSF